LGPSRIDVPYRRFGESSVPCPSRVLCHERRDQQTIDTRYLRPDLFMLVTWPSWVAADDCRAAEQRDELAAPCMSGKQHSEGRRGFGHDRLPVATGSPQALRILNRE